MSSIERLQELISATGKMEVSKAQREEIEDLLTDTPVALERKGWLSMRAAGAAALIPLAIILKWYR
jgi:hypothetical protein